MNADEVDAIAPKRDTAQREMERRIVAQLLTCLDDLAAAGSSPEADDSPTDEFSQLQAAPAPPKHVVVIGELSSCLL